jgi:hypothetical protein
MAQLKKSSKNRGLSPITSDGGMASISYEKALRSGDDAQRKRVFSALREYCESGDSIPISPA